MAKITFNNSSSPFFEALKTRVDNYFSSNDIRPSGNVRLYAKTIILGITAISFYTILVFLTPPVWVSIAICLLFGLNLAAIGFNVMHDGAHGSFSRKKWVNELMAYSLNAMGGNSFIWKNKHNVNHHTYTNIEGMDDDIDIQPWIRVHDEQPKYWFHRFQHIYWVFLYGATYLLWVFVKDFSKYFSGKIAGTNFRKMNSKEHSFFWLSKVFYVSVFIGFPIYQVGLAETLIGYSIIAFVCGLMISVVFQLAHVVEDVQFPVTVGDTNKMANEWAVHQVLTTANFATKSKSVSWFVGGLNFQVEHHLFPKISHIHYPQISKLVKETCTQFNISYNEYPTVLSALRSHVGHLKHVGVN